MEQHQKVALAHAARDALGDRIKRINGELPADEVIEEALVIWACTMHRLIGLDGSPGIDDALELLDIFADLEMARWRAGPHVTKETDKARLERHLTNMEYLFKMPKAIPPGRVLVHNSVRPTRRLGSRGFRAWLASPDLPPGLQPCKCGWAPELGEHYQPAAIRSARAAGPQ